METNFEKIKAILAASNTSLSDQEMFLQSCEGVVDENLELLFELFVESPAWIEKAVNNFKRKKQVYIENDMRAWKDIVDDEVQELQDMENLEKLRSIAN